MEPDYFGDLNAMHDAEKARIFDGANPAISWSYETELNSAMPLGMAVHAPADVRAEAFGRALNLW